MNLVLCAVRRDMQRGGYSLRADPRWQARRVIIVPAGVTHRGREGNS